MTLPTTRTALVADSDHGTKLTSLPIIPPSANELLVKISHVALNPVNWKLLESSTPPGSVLGNDYAGVVISVPPGSPFAVGDRVAGLTVGGFGPLESGAAATYATVEADLAWRIPVSLGSAEATTFGVGGGTAAFLLDYILEAKGNGEWFFVSGASTQVGLFLTQLAKAAGYRVVATASQGNFDLVRGFGADKVVSYKDAQAVEEIAELKPVIVAELAGGSSWEVSREVSRAVGGARYVAILEDPKGEVEFVNFGKVYTPNPKFDPKVREWGAAFYARLPELIESGKLRPAPVTVREGLEGIPQGLEDLKNGKVSGSKLVFSVE